MKKTGLWMVLSGLLLAAVGAGVFLIVRHFRAVVFYYPDRELKQLGQERRAFSVDPEKDYFEVKLVREYLLGPLDYRLTLPLDDSADILDVWVVDPEENGAVVLNFSKGLILALKRNNAGCEWVFEGLRQTLRANTRIKKIFVQVEGSTASLSSMSVGKWKIAHPIPVVLKEKAQPFGSKKSGKP